MRLATSLALLLVASSVHADGGTLRLMRDQGGLRVSVFTSPTPPRVGTIDVSVLVQDAKTGQVRLGLPIKVHASQADNPSRAVEATASHDLATNKLLQAAHLELRRPGRWQLVVVADTIEVTAEVELAGPAPSWWPLAPWVASPFAVVGLFLLRQCWRRTRNLDKKVHSPNNEV